MKSDYPSVSLYVHLPFCEGKCPYCGFYSVPVANCDTRRYIEAVIKELKGYNLDSKAIKTVYIGGGTPTILPQEDLQLLLEALCEKTAGEIEFTIETNPKTSDFQNWRLLKDLGVNRASVGVQSFNDSELKTLGRRYKAADVYRYLDILQQAEIENISLDLIFASPEGNMGSWLDTLQKAIRLPVKHISAYSLSFDEGTAFTKLLKQGKMKALPQAIELEMYERAIDFLEDGGFLQYEISNFARKGFECKHNLTYWQNRDYIGLGASAGSFYKGYRSENFADMGRYIEAIEGASSPKSYLEKIEGKTLACETAVLMLRTAQGINPDIFKHQTGFCIRQTFASEIDENVAKGMLEVSAGAIRLTKAAIPIADSVICDFAS